MQISDHINARASEPLAALVRQKTDCGAADEIVLRETFESLFVKQIPEFELQPTSDRDLILLNDIKAFLRKSYLTNRDLTLSERQISPCGPTYGCLVGPFGNSPIEWLNFVINALVAKTRRATVVSAIKNEGPWLIEWIAHYKALGFDNIIIYYNDCSDGSAELLQALARANEIIAIENVVAPAFSPQRQAFAHALLLLRLTHEAEWVSFLDSDEFLVADEPLNSVSGMIDAVQTASGKGRIDCVAVNWDWFANAEQFTWEDGLVVDRFYSAFKHDMRKCIFRPEFATSIFEIHYPFLTEGAAIVDSSGFAVTDLKRDMLARGHPLLRVNHYFAKSFQEFALKKLRGRGARAIGTEIRSFDAFLWASDGTKQRMINTSLRSALVNEMSRLLAIPGIYDLHESTRERARENLSTMDAEHNLRKIYEQVKRDGEIAQGDRQIQQKNDL